MKKCTRCGQVQYCDRDFQKKHWSEQKKVCIESQTTSGKLPTSCSYCNKSPLDLRKCTWCGNVQYCNHNCQAKDWPEHKKVCTDAMKLQSCDTSKHTSSDHLLKCAFCKKLSDNLKNCSRCGKVQYCDQDCQMRHWPEHKKVCVESVSLKFNEFSQKCAYCKNASFTLKKCTKCAAVQYCSQDCLQNHLPEHKVVCRYITEMNEVCQPSCGFYGSCPEKLFSCKKVWKGGVLWKRMSV